MIAVEGEAEHAADRELRLAGRAGGAVVLDDVAPEADPGAHPAQEPRALAQAQERVERGAVEEAEVAGVGLEVDLREPAHERVEPARGRELEARLALALAPLGDDDVRALAPARDQVGDELGRILEIAVDHHHRVAARVVEPGGQRQLVAEGPRQVQDADAGIALGELVEDRGGGVRRAVVDDHDLVGEVPERGRDASAELGGEPFLVEHRRHHAEQAQLAGGHDGRECRAPEPRYDPVAVTPVLGNILQPLIDFFEGILKFFHDTVGLGWGTSIVALTVLVRAILLPVTYKSSKSMIRLQQLAPEMKALQTKYKQDPQRLQQETMKFYKENSVNPFASCLPMIAQLPVFLALFYMLQADLRRDICPEHQPARRRRRSRVARRTPRASSSSPT